MDLVERLVDTVTSPSANAIREEDCAEVRVVLGDLTESDRRVIELRHFEDRSFTEIAAELGIGLGAAKMRHLRAMERFHGLLIRSGAESGR